MADNNATSSQSLFAATSSSSATFAPGTDTATSAQTLFAVTSSSAATFAPGTDTATSAQTLPAVTASASGIVWDIATCAQTLFAVTSSITATSLEQLVVATATAAELPFQLAEETLTYTTTGELTLSIVWDETTTHAADAAGTITFDVYTSLTGAATAAGTAVLTETRTFTDTAEAKDSLYHDVTVILSSTGNIIGSFGYGREADLAETANASETIDPGVTYTHTVTSTANASDVLTPGGEISVAFAANATGTLTPWVTVTETLSEAANATGVETFDDLVLEILVSTANASHTTTFNGSTYNETLISAADATEWLWAKDLTAIAWVLNTQSGGVTSYNNFDFRSIAFHAGKLYATSPEGLFELDADDDAGRQITASLKSGFLDFGVEEKKHISDIYTGYTGGDLECDVETYDGPEEVYTYEMEYRDADAPRNNRLKVGRGLSSRWWRFAFRNIGGADFQLQDVAVQATTSKRRL